MIQELLANWLDINFVIFKVEHGPLFSFSALLIPLLTYLSLVVFVKKLEHVVKICWKHS